MDKNDIEFNPLKDKILIDAIDAFLAKIKIWELSNSDRQLLNMAQHGNYGAFCDLRASQGLGRS